VGQPCVCPDCGQPLATPRDGRRLWLECAHCGARNLNVLVLGCGPRRDLLTLIMRALGTLLGLVGLFSCVIGLPLVLFAEVPNAAFGGAFNPWPAVLTLLGCIALAGSGFLVQRGLEVRCFQECDKYFGAAFLVGVAAIAALAFVVMTCKVE
jgi:hypothetical protein